MEEFRVGLVGAGSVAALHAEACKQIPEVRLAAVTDVVRERALAFADRHAIPAVFVDFDEMIRSVPLDAVILCVPNRLHSELGVRALEAGLHVLTEKPMAATGDEAARLLAAARRTGKTLQVALHNRYRSDVALLKQYAEGFGEIYYGRCGWFRRRGIPGWGSWFTRRSESGGGPLVDIGVHMLDMCLYLMGYPKPVYVSGATYAQFGPQRKGLGGWGTPDWDGTFDVEDFASALIAFANGATVVLEVSWAAHTQDRMWVEVMGTRGGAVLSESGIQVLTEQYGRPVDLKPQPEPNRERVAQMREFIRCCRTGQEPLTSGEQALVLNRIFDAIYASAREGGRQVMVEP